MFLSRLTRLSHELVDALSLYHTLMREMPSMPYPAYAMPSYMPGMPPASMPSMPMSNNPGGMPAYSMPVNGMSGMPGPGMGGPGGPVYYMDPNMSAHGYHGSAPPPPPMGYPGSAPPPTPPLQQDPTTMMGQNPDQGPHMIYSNPQMIYSAPQ